MQVPGFTIDYPVTDAVREELRNYPNIDSLVRIQGDTSPLEIVRILGNTHYPHLMELLAFLEEAAPKAKHTVKRVLQQSDPFGLSRALAELFLLRYLQSQPGLSAVDVSPRSAQKRYDIDLTAADQIARIEVYCPIDFFGSQIAEATISRVFKYLPVAGGFNLELALRTVDPMDYAWPYEAGEETSVQSWLKHLQREAVRWLGADRPASTLEMEGPSKGLILRGKVLGFTKSSAARTITLSLPTKSTDTRLFFEVGSAEDTANSQWGRKILDKLSKRQCGMPDPAVTRLLVVDFSHADTAHPDFICWPRISQRMNETISLLSQEAGEPLPYDAVLPAQLGRQCCFGEAVALSDIHRADIADLTLAAELRTRCEPLLSDAPDYAANATACTTEDTESTE